jgi:hypothetical protein
MVNCNDLWTRFVHVVHRLTRRPVLTPEPPADRRNPKH